MLSRSLLRVKGSIRAFSPCVNALHLTKAANSTSMGQVPHAFALINMKFSSESQSRYINDMVEMYSKPQINMTDLLISRHNFKNKALIYIDGDDLKTYTYEDCERLSSHLAILLADQGVQKGDRIAVMLPKSPQIVIAALALWRMGCIFVPLFAAFEKDAIRIRLSDSCAKIVITDTVNRDKFNFTSTEGLNVDFMTTIIDSKKDTKHNQYSLIRSSDVVFSLRNFEDKKGFDRYPSPVLISPADTICLLYTSGTTGLPKGVTIPAFSLASFHVYMEQGLGLQSDTTEHHGANLSQRYLSIADPAWAYGLYYNLIGPLLTGISLTYVAGVFDPHKVLRALADYKITHFAAAPSAYRALCAYDQSEKSSSSVRDEKEGIFSILRDNLQCASSAGEPLNPEIIDWWRGKMKGRTIADHYGQSEAGMMVNWHWADGLLAPKTQGITEEWTLKGSMGRGMDGFRMVCLKHEDGVVNGEILNEAGELAVDLSASPLMWFQGYLNNPERSREAFTACKKYYLTGDTVTQKGDNNNDSVFWFSSRKDDVIKSSGKKFDMLLVKYGSLR